MVFGQAAHEQVEWPPCGDFHTGASVFWHHKDSMAGSRAVCGLVESRVLSDLQK